MGRFFTIILYYYWSLLNISPTSCWALCKTVVLVIERVNKSLALYCVLWVVGERKKKEKMNEWKRIGERIVMWKLKCHSCPYWWSYWWRWWHCIGAGASIEYWMRGLYIRSLLLEWKLVVVVMILLKGVSSSLSFVYCSFLYILVHWRYLRNIMNVYRDKAFIERRKTYYFLAILVYVWIETDQCTISSPSP